MTAQSTQPPGIVIDARLWPDLAGRRRRLLGRLHSAVAEQLFRAAVSRLDVAVHYPDGRVVGGAAAPVATSPAHDDVPTMVLHRPEAFMRRLGEDGLIGFGESYMAGDWDSPDLGRFLTVLAARIARLVPEPLQRLRRLYVARHPSTARNSTANTRSNIAHHYDLSNDLFALFLDETMTYSSALFPPDHTARPEWLDLAGGQCRKIDALLDAAHVGPGTRVLEIGTGWGELAIRAARRGARVHSVTLSSDQQELARRRVAAAGCEDAVIIDLRDYRDVVGEYDAVVSVEMIEAVGHEFWDTYFATVKARLAAGGRFAVQAITMPHERMLATKDTYTWIQKYIFPGGFLPSTTAIVGSAGRASLGLEVRTSFGSDYAETLRLWDERFTARAAEVQQLGFDEVFRRMWHFYLEYSRAGFASGYLDVEQLTFTKETP